MAALTATEARLAALISRESPTADAALRFHRTWQDKRLDFASHAFMLRIYFEAAAHLVVMKSTQCGASEYLICRALNRALVYGRSIFYVLPTFELAARFVRNRVDRTLTYTPTYLSEARASAAAVTESMKLKHLGDGTLAFVGSQSPAVFSEFPADEVIVDELDWCDQDNVLMAWERMSASEVRDQVWCSQPTIPGYGIDVEYANSTRRRWYVRCGCGEWVHPDWFRHVVRELADGRYELRDREWSPGMDRDVRLLCDRCDRPLDGHGEGAWGAENESADREGYHINKLFSTHVEVRELVERFERGLRNPSAMQRFYNGDLGLPYTAGGSRITDADVLGAVEDGYLMPAANSEGVVVAGVDVGTLLHVRINRLEPDGRRRALFIGTVRELDDLQALARRYSVRVGVIDALPEQRLARTMCRTPGWFMCFYGRPKQEVAPQLKARVLTVDRTESLDATREQLTGGALILPANVREIPDYVDQLGASVRVYDDASDRYVWTEGSADDHYLHAENYARLAAERVRRWRPV